MLQTLEQECLRGEPSNDKTWSAVCQVRRRLWIITPLTLLPRVQAVAGKPVAIWDLILRDAVVDRAQQLLAQSLDQGEE